MPRTPLSPASPQLTGETIPRDLVDSSLAALPSPASRRTYNRGMQDLIAFAGKRTITLTLLHKWRDAMAAKLEPATVNLRIAAGRRLLLAASAAGLVSNRLAVEIMTFKGVRNRGQNTGNWLTREQARALLNQPNRRTPKGKRAYCVLAILTGCALRREELAALNLEQVQTREGRWVIADLRGKGGRRRTVAMPAWVKQAIDGWTSAAAITSGPIIRRLPSRKHPVPPATRLTTYSVWEIVKEYSTAIAIPNLSPHDLRRTCAKLCRQKGGRIEQIQAMLGHASIATTERYLGTTQDLRHAVNDDLGIW